MKSTVLLTTMLFISMVLISFNAQSQTEEKYSTCEYAYVRVEGQIDRRLSVEVDLGEGQMVNDMEETIEDELSDYESYVQILQYFLDRDYKLEKIMDQMFMSSSGGGSEGVAYIFKRPGADKSGD